VPRKIASAGKHESRFHRAGYWEQEGGLRNERWRFEAAYYIRICVVAKVEGTQRRRSVSDQEIDLS
jgi:hypothetical protein